MVELQTTIAHQAEEISDLSKELYVQQKELAKLKQELADLKARFRMLEDSSGVKDISEETPPPHY